MIPQLETLLKVLQTLKPVKLDREANIEKLKSLHFDFLIIGGGAVGTGIALEAAAQGFLVGLVEKNDFASETSSRSTKTPHGGFRYLEQALFTGRISLLKLVYEALHERQHFFKNAPHLAEPQAFVIPVRSYWKMIYYYIGLKVYELLAGAKNPLPRTRLLRNHELKKTCPFLDSTKLKGGIQYYDGKFNDARMNLAIALTAEDKGASLANYIEVIGFVQTSDKITAVSVKNSLNNEVFLINSKVVINATGAFVDYIRQLDDPLSAPIIEPSIGSHIALDEQYPEPKTSVLIPETEDGRVLFIMPFQGKTIVGTTDIPTTVKENPKPSEAEIDFILKEAGKYYTTPPTRKNITSQWAGIRPLFKTKESNTGSISREHHTEISSSGLVTGTGGKWTTYRPMAKDILEIAKKNFGLIAKKQSHTESLPLIGGKYFSPLITDLLLIKFKLSKETALHLSETYGDLAFYIADKASQDDFQILTPKYPYLMAEIIYAVEFESARTLVDFLARRVRLSFIDKNAAIEAIPKVADLMSEKLKWNSLKKEKEITIAMEYFK